MSKKNTKINVCTFTKEDDIKMMKGRLRTPRPTIIEDKKHKLQNKRQKFKPHNVEW